MARLRNSNGQIVIDETEAEADAKKIEQAKAKLEEAHKLLDPSKLDSYCMRGETRDALEEIFSKLLSEFKSWEDNCSAASKYIRDVVKKYQRIDREYTAKISGSSSNRFSGSGGIRRF